MFSKCNLFAALGDRMGDMRVVSKCATAVKIKILFGARTPSIPSERTCVCDRKSLRHLASVGLTCMVRKDT